MSLTRVEVANAVYYQLKPLWDAAGLTVANDSGKGAEGDLTLPIDRTLRWSGYKVDEISIATNGTPGEEKTLDLAEWFALDRLISALAVYVDVQASTYSPKSSQMATVAQAMYDRKTKYLASKYGIGREDIQTHSTRVKKADGWRDRAEGIIDNLSVRIE